ncbi:hypothetical protein Y032_0005g2283 [Ancylostoma ceylanicum]|nr:hypothetical protein Y032_0005g2283 [Ancylostoma ceylanicum]
MDSSIHASAISDGPHLQMVSADSNDYVHASFMCTFYVCLGFFSAACNLLNLLIIFSSKELRRRFIYLAALNICELVNAISYVLVGYGRRLELERGTLFTPTTVSNCFLEKFWPHALILGTELPAFMMILISYERFLAVLRPMKYKRFFRESQKFLLILTVPTAALVSLSTAWFSVYVDGERIVTSRYCFIIDSTGPWYSTFHFTMIVAAFFVSFLSFVAAYRIGKRLTHGNVIGKKHNLGLWMAISASSTFLISTPSFVMVYKLWTNIQFDDVTIAITYAMPGFLSIGSTAMNFAFHAQFRQQFVSFFRIQ